MPRVFVGAFTTINGADNPLKPRVPIGACIVKVAGEDCSSMTLDMVGELLSSMEHCPRTVHMRYYHEGIDD